MRYLSTAAMVVLLLIPAGLLVAASQLFPAEPTEIVQETVPIVAPVALAERVETRAVVVRVSYDTPQVLVAPNWSGLVTEVLVERGAGLDSGSVVARVGDKPVVAMVTPRPFARDLASGDRGADVQMLQQMLLDAGYDPGAVDGRFGSATGRAVKEWRTTLGDTSPANSFAVGSIIWLEAPIASVSSVELRAGTPVPAAGSTVVTAEPGAKGAVVVDDTSDQPILDTAGFSLWVGETNLGRIDDGRLNEAQAAEFQKLIDDGSVDPVVAANPAPTNTVNAPSQQRVSDFSAEIRQDNATRIASLPGSAVLSAGERTCVLVDAGNGVYRSVEVEVTGGQLDNVEINPETAPAEPVLVNPLDVVDNASCG